jgi:predicted ATPase
MSTFEKFHVQGFRRLQDVDVKLKSLNVMIGANSSGKTTLLDVFTLLAASASGNLAETISDFGGVDSNLTNLLAANANKSCFMPFDLAMPVSGHNPIDYRLSLSPKGAGYEITDETLTQKGENYPTPFKHIDAHHTNVRYFEPPDGLTLPNWDYDAGESALSQVPKMF